MTKKQQPDYYKIIPQHLLADADALINYVRYFPYQFPTKCPHCEYSSFKQLTTRNVVDEPRFQCYFCKKEFSQLTGTYFARMTRMELWPDFIMYRLVGIPLKKIHQRLNISQHACIVRERRLNQMMQDLFPKLYQWWKPHHDYTDHTLTAEISKEQKVIINWVKKRINQQTATCPQCRNFIRQRLNLRNKKEGTHKNRPYFECGKCAYKFSIFKETPLNRLLHMDLWVPFIKELCQGKNNEEILNTLSNQHKLKLGLGTIINWRKRFIEQMQILGLTNLVAWLKWQRVRNKAAETRENKKAVDEKNKDKP